MCTTFRSFQSAVLVLVIVAAQTTLGTTIYVDQKNPQASDESPGTAQMPLKTISAAARIAEPDDTILVHEGVYRERVAPARGGEEGTPIVYQAAPGDRVIIKGSNVFAPQWKLGGEAESVYFGKFPADLFPVGGITWETAPANDRRSGGGSFDEKKQRGGGVDASRALYLGSFEMDNTDYVLSRGAGHEVAFDADALVDFLEADTNGVVTFILTRITSSGSLMCAFA